MLKRSGIIFERKNNKKKEKVTSDTGKRNDKQKSKKEAEEKIHEEIHKAQKVLFRCKTRFPFDIFPDSISVDTEKITIQASYFFFIGEAKTYELATIIGEAKTYELATIKRVVTDDAFFFSTVSLYGDAEEKPLLFLKNLSHTNARVLYDLIRGILQAEKNEIELNDISEHKLFDYLIQLGKLYT